MPSCQNCTRLENQICTGYETIKSELKRDLPPSPVGGCIIPIVDGYLDQIKANMNVLEIGCGTWRKVIDHCQKVGAHYDGMDVQEEYYGIPCVATRYENLANLSFNDNSFDLVIGNQTMEHWGEHGCTPAWGLYQCFRVLKPGGKLFLNVPIHFHGTENFLLGQFTQIENLFKKFSDQVNLEKWGIPSGPLPPFFAHPNYPTLANSPVHILSIEATKDRELPCGITNNLGFSGKLAQLVHYPISYNLYRLKSKVLGWRSRPPES